MIMDIKKMISEMGAQYEGKYIVLNDGDKFYGVPPTIEADKEVVYKAEAKPSYGYNGGAYVFNSGEGYAILTCCGELAEKLMEQLRGRVSSGAWVHFYNASVWFDAKDGRIVKMAAACGK